MQTGSRICQPVLCGFFRNLLRKPCLEDGLRASDKEQLHVSDASVAGSFPVFRPSFHILIMCTGHVLETSKFTLLIKFLDIEELSLENRCFHKHIIFAGGLRAAMMSFNSWMLIPIGIVQPQCLPAFKTRTENGACVAGGVTR